MGTLLNFPSIHRQPQSRPKQTHRILKQSPETLVALPNDRILLSIQNALEEARLTHDWRASKKKIECAIRQANLALVHSGH